MVSKDDIETNINTKPSQTQFEHANLTSSLMSGIDEPSRIG